MDKSTADRLMKYAKKHNVKVKLYSLRDMGKNEYMIGVGLLPRLNRQKNWIFALAFIHKKIPRQEREEVIP